jgi:8-amino-7-oxononanoate synthase
MPATDTAGARRHGVATLGRMDDPADWRRRLENRARLRARAGLTRSLRARGPVRTAGDPAPVDLAGNDYLGLSHHPDVVAAAARALREYGLGATGSRVVRGSTLEHEALEAALAAHLRQERALVYSSGYLANLGAIAALTPPRGRILLDAHAHASLYDGSTLAGAPTTTFAHSDVAALRMALASGDAAALVITESVYSVDGDLAPLADLADACAEFGAVLLVDDAHALGVLGDHGAGAVAAAGLAGAPHVVVTTTLSKAVGAAGGVVAGPDVLVRHLVDAGRTFVYDTALPPAVAAGARAALHLLRAADDARAIVHERAHAAAKRLRDAGVAVCEPSAGIVSATAADAAAAVEWAARCAAAGVAVGCFRPPSTPDGSSRLRLTINAGVPASDFERALDVVAAVP